MSTHRFIDRICCAGLALALMLTLLFFAGEALGLQAAAKTMGYEDRLFDTSRVHTIDIVMDDWDGFLDTCENEEYTACAVVIDSEAYHNAGLRAKGNTSLSSVAAYGNDRYSFKVEFDCYQDGVSYYGLDKLSLNNIIQDNTYLKDYLSYRMMASFGAAAPLCSFAFLTVNGEDWGLYLAVEGVEDGFLQRNYGADYGSLYKPDSMSFGGGRGNGRDFDMAEFELPAAGEGSEGPPEGMDPPAGFGGGGGFRQAEAQMPADGEGGEDPPEGVEMPASFGGMGSGDVKLQYTDDDPDSYPNIFGNAKTDVTEADQARLMQALKILNEGTEISAAVSVEEVLRYFVVHNFVCNGDSYTGSMVHNYYLYEEDGLLSMIPWDYNLAFGAFQGGDASGQVNAPIDTPVSSGGGADSRPMVDWIFEDEAYTAQYHQYFAEFLEGTDFATLIDETAALIAPYVEKDPTAFYGYEDFQTGAAALREFCLLRAESAAGQLAGTIPSTSAGQASDGSALVDASHLDLSDMGTMNGGGFPGGGKRPEAVPAGNMDGAQPPERDGERPSASPDGGGKNRDFPGNFSGEASSGRSGGGWALLGGFPGGPAGGAGRRAAV